MDFRPRIKEILKEKGLLQKNLAKRLGITEIGLSQTLGQPYPQLQTLERIATALEVNVTELFSSKGDGFMAVVDYDGKLRRFDSISALKAFIGEIEETRN